MYPSSLTVAMSVWFSVEENFVDSVGHPPGRSDHFFKSDPFVSKGRLNI
jgi:hypothetical protein